MSNLDCLTAPDGAAEAVLSQRPWQAACRGPAPAGRANLHRSQWLAAVRRAWDCAAAKTFDKRWKRWSDNDVFARIMIGLAAGSAGSAGRKTIAVDATDLKAQCTASGPSVKQAGAKAGSGEAKVA